MLEFMAQAFLKALHLVNILLGIRLALIVRRCFHPFLQRYSWLSPQPSRLAYLRSMHQAYHRWPEERERKGKREIKVLFVSFHVGISLLKKNISQEKSGSHEDMKSFINK